MKKFWVILLSLGLIVAFAMPAAAVDVKFSGTYYAQGFYVDNPSVLDKNAPADTATSTTWANNPYRGANAWYGQQFRLTTEFQVVEGLKLVTRFDAMEKRWGDQAWAGGTGETQSRTQTPGGTPGNNSGSAKAGAATAKAQENIEWERAYLDFNVPFGKFQVGYMQFLTWGTPFLNTPLTAGGIRYFYANGPVQVVAAIEKRAEYVGLNAANIGIANDADKDLYDLGITYKFAPGQAGLLYQYLRSGQNKWQQGNGYLTQINGFYPYAQLTFGNFYIEAEGVYGTGTLRSYEDTTKVPTSGGAAADGSKAQNVSLTAWGAYINAKYNFKPAYVGAQFVYLGGDDNSNADKVTGNIAGPLQANYGFNRSLILWNSDYGDNLGAMYGNMPGYGTTAAAATQAQYFNRRTGGTYAVNQFMDNVWFYQIYAGFKPMPKMDIKASFSIATADKAPKSDVGTVGQAGYYTGAAVKEFTSKSYGNEFDLTAEYKIYDNLTYMIGMGYLWTGDYFKGYDSTATVKDNYLLTHKLSLNF